MITRLRTQQIVIDIPRTTSEPWVMIKVQKVEMDESGKELNVVDRFGTINRRLSDVALEVVPYFEVVPDLVAHISAFAVADAIKSIAVSWIIEEYGGTVNQDGDVIIHANN